MKKIKVAELFAGVGGFRLGLEGWDGKSSLSNYTKKKEHHYEVVWSNQFEPKTKKQHASEIYENRWGAKNHSNVNIEEVPVEEMPDFDMLVGGFPCQDYSVAKHLSKSKGIQGKKGVLWWEIIRILTEKKGKKPKFLLFENVDRLIKSPVKQRGRDFAIMLASLSDLGYAVEWRVINAAEYGMPQRRRRVFILGYLKSSSIYNHINEPVDWMATEGLFANAFKVNTPNETVNSFRIDGSLEELTTNFNSKNGGVCPFGNAGFLDDRKIWTFKSIPNYDGKYAKLKDIVLPLRQVAQEYKIGEASLDKWEYLKGKKNEKRTRRDGSIFFYKEGPLSFPDPLDRPARTIITAEGGTTPSRFKHVIRQGKSLRRLTPIELERANMFPDNHTQEASDTKRAFFMGNALVVGVVERIGDILYEFSNRKVRKGKKRMLEKDLA